MSSVAHDRSDPRRTEAPGSGAYRRPRARKGEGERLRDEILEAATALLAERGNKDAVSIRAVAERVGVSPPAIYLHFADKDELFYECCRVGFEELSRRLEEAAATAGTALERLGQMGRAYIDYALERGPQYRVLMIGGQTGSVSPELIEDDPGLRAFAVLVGTIREGIEAGEIRDDQDPVALAVAVWAAVHGAVMLLLSRQAAGEAASEVMPDLPPVEMVVDAVLALVRSGVVKSG